MGKCGDLAAATDDLYATYVAGAARLLLLLLWEVGVGAALPIVVGCFYVVVVAGIVVEPVLTIAAHDGVAVKAVVAVIAAGIVVEIISTISTYDYVVVKTTISVVEPTIVVAIVGVVPIPTGIIAAVRSFIVVAIVVAVTIIVIVVVLLVVAIAVVVVVAVVFSRDIVVAHTAFSTAEHYAAIGRKCARPTLCPTRTGITYIDAGAVVIEIVGTGVAVVDAEDKPIAAPRKWTEKIVGTAIERILPIEEDIAEIGITKRPIVAEEVVAVVDGQEIVEVHLIATLVLFGREVKFIGHFVSQEVSVFAGLSVAHRVESRGGNKEDEGEQKSFHNIVVLCR